MKEDVRLNSTLGKIYNLFCPDCKRDTKHSVLQSVDIKGSDGYEDDWVTWDSKYQIIECQGCSYRSFRNERTDSEDVDPETGKPLTKQQLYPNRSKFFWNIKDFYNAPHNLRQIYREVIHCYNGKLYTMCAGGLRAIIEGICADQGVKNGPIEIKNKGIKIKRTKNLEGKIN
ncbi:MAG: hypothetical protein ABSG42_03070, partial [Nitrospirota bacterium]